MARDKAKQCEYNRQYKRDKDKKREYDRQYKAEHREEILAQKKSHWYANKEKINERRKEEYHQNQEKRDKRLAYMKQYQAENKEVAKNYKLIRSYGIGIDEYNNLYKKQEGRCAICKRPGGTGRAETLVVDHDHETGFIRGLLCPQCNVGIGGLQENKRIIIAALFYLERAMEEYIEPNRKLKPRNTKLNQPNLTQTEGE